jgi:hypothetical protein
MLLYESLFSLYICMESASRELVSSLTNKNRKFLSNIVKGMKIFDAYSDAGYKGDAAAAYALKYRLRNELSALISSKSTIDDTLLELEQLDEMQLMQTQITMNQKLRVIALKLQALKQKHAEQSDNAPKTFTAFVIDRNTNEVQTNKVIDAEVIDDKNQVSPTSNTAQA